MQTLATTELDTSKDGDVRQGQRADLAGQSKHVQYAV